MEWKVNKIKAQRKEKVINFTKELEKLNYKLGYAKCLEAIGVGAANSTYQEYLESISKIEKEIEEMTKFIKDEMEQI